MGKRNKVFISYSHKDQHEYKRLMSHLKALQLQDIVKVWSDEDIETGADWFEEIKKAIAMSKAAIFLVSVDFLSSKFIMHEEVPPLLQNAKTHGVTIIPVYIGRCENSVIPEIIQLQAINTPSKPISALRSKDEKEQVWDSVAGRVKELKDLDDNAVSEFSKNERRTGFTLHDYPTYRYNNPIETASGIEFINRYRPEQKKVLEKIRRVFAEEEKFREDVRFECGLNRETYELDESYGVMSNKPPQNIITQIGEWFIDEEGMYTLENSYDISRAVIFRDDLIRQVGTKTWCDLETFIRALQQARNIFTFLDNDNK